MIKRMLAIVVTASLASAGLLFIGTTLIGRFSPAFASSLPALVAGNGRSGLDDTPAAAASTPQAAQTDNHRGANKPEDNTPQSTAVDNRRGADKPEDNATPQAGQAVSGTPVSGVSIAQLLASPANFLDGVFNLSGIATSLSNDKFLINDGTGQIIVDLEDNLVSVMVLSGSTVSVTGEFRESGGQRGFEIKACVVTDQNGSVVVDVCEFGRHGLDEPFDDHGGQNGLSGTDDRTGTNQNGVDDKGGQNGNSSSGSSNSGSGSPTDDNSGSGKHGGDDNPKP